MKSWSVRVPDNLRVGVFLDTNILCYLVDNTYPSLTQFIQDISTCCCVELISSDFCQIEFTGIRKREHYLRLIIEQSRAQNKTVNVSSLLKYHNQFGCEEIKFEDVIDEIETKVKSDIDRVVSEFGIKFTSMNSQISSLARDICLNSKISKEDSLVLASAGMDSNKQVIPCILLTNDSDFGKWYNEKKLILEKIFTNYEIVLPHVLDIRQIWGYNLHDVCVPQEEMIIRLKDMLMVYNPKTYLGISFQPQQCILNKYPNLLAFHSRNTIYQNKYVCELSADLQSFVNIPNKGAFYHKNALVDEGFVFAERSDDIVTFLIDNMSKVYAEEDYQEILNMLQQSDNLVFYIEE